VIGAHGGRLLFFLLTLGTVRGAQGRAIAELDGGITLRSRAPLYDNRLSYPTGRMKLLRRGQLDGVVALSHVNTWAQMPGYFFDGEFSRLELRLAYGVTPLTEVAVHVGALRRSGGIMDGFIEGFHHLMHITQSRRDLYPRNRLLVATVQNQQEQAYLTDADAGTGLTGPILVVRQGLGGPRERPVLTAELHLQLPLWSELQPFRAQGPTVLLALSTSQRLSGWLDVFAAGGVMIAPNAGSLYGMPLAGLDKFLVLGLGLRLHERLRLALHYHNQDGIVEAPRFWPMHLSTNEFVLGLKWSPKIWPQGAFELGIIENSVHDANTPDFGGSLAIAFTTG
jgi:hypothetical protein